MGLNTNEGTGKTFVTILGKASKFVTRCNQGDEGAISRLLENGPNEGKEVFEKHYDSLSGKIESISYTSKEFGNFIEIDIDGCSLQIPWKNFKVRDAFIKRLPNINLDEDVVFSVFPDKETKRPVFLIKQGGDLVSFAFTKDNPNGLPEPVEKEDKGEKVWDFSASENFLFNVLMDAIAKFEPQGE